MVQGGGERLQVLTDVSGITSAAHVSDGDSEDSSNKGCLFAILGPSGVTACIVCIIVKNKFCCHGACQLLRGRDQTCIVCTLSEKVSNVEAQVAVSALLPLSNGRVCADTCC